MLFHNIFCFGKPGFFPHVFLKCLRSNPWRKRHDTDFTKSSSAFHPHLQETAPGRRETFHQHTWLRDELASSLEDQLSRGSGTLQPRPGSWHGLFYKGRCAVPWSLAACERARPPGSASDQPLTPSCKGRGVGVCAGPLFLEACLPRV